LSGPETIAHTLAEFAGATTFQELPPHVVHSVKQRVLDTLGICLAASSFGLADGVADLVGGWGGRAESGVAIREGRYPAPQAAFVNGTLALSLDFDDIYLPSVLHPSVSVVPAALAMAEASGVTGAELIAAIAVGLELTVRTGMGGYLEDEGNVFFNRGWHATSICGTLGCAASGAGLIGLGRQGIQDALGIAASLGGGIIEANRAGGTVKRLHCGWAAHAGLIAAQLARNGFTGPPSVFEGRFGFYQAFLDGHYDPRAVLEGLGERWAVPDIFFKPYPANHYTHAGIDAALAVRREHGGPVEPEEARMERAVEQLLAEPGRAAELLVRQDPGWNSGSSCRASVQPGSRSTLAPSPTTSSAPAPSPGRPPRSWSCSKPTPTVTGPSKWPIRCCIMGRVCWAWQPSARPCLCAKLALMLPSWFSATSHPGKCAKQFTWT